MTKKPNILLIMTDQHRWDAMSCAGHPLVRTPNMDRLAREGVWFRQAVTSCPLCVPARASLASSLMPLKLGIVNNTPARRRPDATLMTCLNEAGYHTQAIGRMHFLPQGQETYGFQDLMLAEDTWVATQGRQMDSYDRYLRQHGLFGWNEPVYVANQIMPCISPLPQRHNQTTWVGDRAVEYLSRPPASPFFLWTSFVKPHVPFDVPPEHKDMYRAEDVPWGRIKQVDLDHRHPDMARVRRFDQWRLYSEEANRESAAHYFANITLIDEQVGRMLDVLERSGRLSNTIIIYVSDHGEMLGDHGLWFKKFGYEGSWRIPLIIRGGPFTGGAPSDILANIMDIMPTALAAAGVDVPPGLSGNDLHAVQSGRQSGPEHQVGEIDHYGGQMTYLRSRRWKYIHHEKGGFEELYDLARDPEEFHNVAAEHADECAASKDAIAAYLRRHSDPAASLDGAGKLRTKPYVAMPDCNDKPLPFSLHPWHLRTPPALLGAKFPGDWWWKMRPRPDWAIDSQEC
jgi:choline-sulfatase